MNNLKLYIFSLMFAFMLALPAHAVVDDTLCSASDVPGGTSCNATQLKAYASEEYDAHSKRAPIYLTQQSGTDTIVATAASATAKPLVAYTNGQPFYLKPSNTITGPATLNIDTVGAIAIQSSTGAALGAGDLRNDTLYPLVYYSAGPAFRVVSTLGAGAAPVGSPFVTIGNVASLTAERALTAGTGLGLTDGGANSTVTLAITDAELACILAQTSAADKISYWTGSGTCALADFSSSFRTFLTTSSLTNLASVLTDEASGWATFNATPSMANLGSFLTDDASGWTTFGTTPSMANLGSLLSDDASGWTTFGTTPTSANLGALLTNELDSAAKVLLFLGAPADDQVAVGDSATATTWRAIPDSDGATQKLQYDVTTNTFSAGTDDDIPDVVGDLALIDTSAELRTLLTDELGTGVLFFLGAPAADDQVFVSSSVSAGAWGSIPDSDAATQKLQYDVTTNAFSAGTDDDVPEAGADFVNIALTGDVTSVGLATTVAANAVALTTDTTGNYMTDITAGAGIAVTHTPAEGSTGTIAFTYADAGASPALAADSGIFTGDATTNGEMVFEGDTADTIETRIIVTDPTVSDKTFTIPNANSVAVQSITCGGSDKISSIGSDGLPVCTADSGGSGGSITLGSSQATTSGTSIDFTGIASGTNRITVMLVGVSVSGTSPPLLQIGDAGGIENTGYTSVGSRWAAGVSAEAASTAGVNVNGATATYTYHGTFTLNRVDGDLWVINHQSMENSANIIFMSSGTKTLSAELDRIRLTTVGGVNTFDAGSMNISYE